MEFLYLLLFCFGSLIVLGYKFSITVNEDFRDKYDFRCYCPKHGDMPWRHAQYCDEFLRNKKK